MGWIEDDVLHALWKAAPRPRYGDAFKAVQDEDVKKSLLTAAHNIRDAAMELSWRRYDLGIQPLNHRHFFVGGVALGIVPAARGTYEWWASAAWNTKPQPGDEKYCSERRLGKRALKARCKCIVAIAVVGERNDDSRSGISYSTLEPCESCRDDMRGRYRPLYRRETRVLMQNPHNSHRAEKSLMHLMRGHGESWP